ncbi:hypothetical protein DFQ27_001526 [Actinomortierella ambigua]|uniref:Uncharacterized protein n=1 Tax=Actinomortierella ambigua TaxID=1343610 RepID=A0A9P6QAD3_9FUNG|nr:hypothetical protein DFQ27_001526 [Actinomortierella ambigua]
MGVAVTPPRHLPHSPVRHHQSPSLDLFPNDVHASNFIDDKRVPPPAGGHMGTLSLSVPIFITLVFVLIVLATMGIAHCLYRRYARNLERAFGIHNNNNNNQVVGSYTWRFSNYNDVSDEGGLGGDGRGRGRGRGRGHQDPTERDQLLGNDDINDDGSDPQFQEQRRRSTSYYDANRSRSAAPVAIQTDMRGRPISTWSTASSVAAQRGEELSRWSKRRDELIAQYGQGKVLLASGGSGSSSLLHQQHQQYNTNSVYYNSLTEGPEDIVQEEDEEQQQDEQEQGQGGRGGGAGGKEGGASEQRNHTGGSDAAKAMSQNKEEDRHRQQVLHGEYSALEQEQLMEALQQMKHYEHDTTFGREPAEAPGSALVSSSSTEYGTGILP